MVEGESVIFMNPVPEKKLMESLCLSGKKLRDYGILLVIN